MDKGRKLKRYGRKDYSQLVEFPVEIIGRDGVVRRYNFEQSVQLYQRRIASAGLRYSDASVVHAEVGHCRQRIQQLRRSYFVRHGWPALEQLDVFTQAGPGLAADLALFCAEHWSANKKMRFPSVFLVCRSKVRNRPYSFNEPRMNNQMNNTFWCTCFA